MAVRLKVPELARNFATNWMLQHSSKLAHFHVLLLINPLGGSRSAHSINMSGNTPKSMSNRLMTMKASFQLRAARDSC
jgi:hypothetical protein